MDEVNKYIFSRLHVAEDALRNINRFLKKQGKLNRKLATLAVACTAFAVVTEVQRKELNNKIDGLVNELKEMRLAKGE